jgi:hypothetical protein
MTGGWRRRAFTARHSIPLPLAITLAWLLFNCVSLWLSSDFQAKEELLNQARVFKDFGYRYVFFAIHEPALVMK